MEVFGVGTRMTEAPFSVKRATEPVTSRSELTEVVETARYLLSTGFPPSALSLFLYKL